ncbi:MAG: hypothetical protein KIS78_13460 [Labilithrix sp.]|nr:hypothetical protein [Labilithrix sp.]MCW5833404.1 hypothetical protein [Labilithrix sp.]
MSASDDDMPPSERMQRLERRANVIRERLFRAVDALDARRHQVVRIGTEAKKMVKPAAISLLGVAAVVGVGAFALGLALRKRRRRSLKGAVSHALQGLDIVPQRSLSRRVFESITLSVLTFAATELAKQAAKNLLDGRLPSGRLMVGRALGEHQRRLAQGDGAAR